MKIIGIVADFTNHQQFELADQIVNIINNDTQLDSVVFYENICKVKRAMRTATMSIDNIQYFNGTLIHLSMAQMDNISHIPFNVTHYYIPDYDQNFNLLKLLYLSEVHNVAVMSQQLYSNLERMIGNNKSMIHHPNPQSLVEHIS